MKKIIDFVEHLECPSINGIIFPDDTIQLLDVRVDWENPINYTIEITSKTSIKNLRDKGELWWSSCAILVELVDLKHSIEVIAGEGGYGSDGFISVIDSSSKKLIWLAFFKCSNPFDEIKIIDEEIHAKSTIGCLWKFKIKNPVHCMTKCD